MYSPESLSIDSIGSSNISMVQLVTLSPESTTMTQYDSFNPIYHFSPTLNGTELIDGELVFVVPWASEAGS